MGSESGSGVSTPWVSPASSLKRKRFHGEGGEVGEMGGKSVDGEDGNGLRARKKQKPTLADALEVELRARISDRGNGSAVKRHGGKKKKT